MTRDEFNTNGRRGLTMAEEYLGDGLYASYDGWQIKLRAPQEAGNHEVSLGPGTLAALLRFIERIHRIKLTVSRSATEANDEHAP